MKVSLWHQWCKILKNYESCLIKISSYNLSWWVLNIINSGSFAMMFSVFRDLRIPFKETVLPQHLLFFVGFFSPHPPLIHHLDKQMERAVPWPQERSVTQAQAWESETWKRKTSRFTRATANKQSKIPSEAVPPLVLANPWTLHRAGAAWDSHCCREALQETGWSKIVSALHCWVG